ncbi:hypothetical protein ACTXHA_28915 [Burkholderia cenocepacia]
MKFIVLCFAFATSTAIAQESPDRFPVKAGFLPISDGSYHVVLLTNDSSIEKYCQPNWHVGLIQTQFKTPKGPVVGNVGCWGHTASSQSISFRYFDIAQGGVREFQLDASKMMPMVYEWRTERLFPQASQ